jgi:hypothetical protein
VNSYTFMVGTGLFVLPVILVIMLLSKCTDCILTRYVDRILAGCRGQLSGRCAAHIADTPGDQIIISAKNYQWTDLEVID